jgi:peroxiredoxin family protein
MDEPRLSALEDRVAALESRVAALPAARPSRVCIIAFSGDLDRLLAALTVATGAGAMGVETRMFFTFWAVAALRKPRPGSPYGTLFERALRSMLPRGASQLALSRMNMGGLGTLLMRKRMASKQVSDIDELLAMARQAGVKVYLCDMSVDLLGFRAEEFRDDLGLEHCGVATFLGDALESDVSLFI